MVDSGIGTGDGWRCTCGNTVPTHLLRCPKCQTTLSLDRALNALPTELPSPPMDEWVKEDEVRKNYSKESMDEVMKLARKRKRPWGKWKIRWSVLLTLGITTVLIVASFVI
jgi:hypothetical protein